MNSSQTNGRRGRGIKIQRGSQCLYLRAHVIRNHRLGARRVVVRDDNAISFGGDFVRFYTYNAILVGEPIFSKLGHTHTDQHRVGKLERTAKPALGGGEDGAGAAVVAVEAYAVQKLDACSLEVAEKHDVVHMREPTRRARRPQSTVNALPAAAIAWPPSQCALPQPPICASRIRRWLPVCHRACAPPRSRSRSGACAVRMV